MASIYEFDGVATLKTYRYTKKTLQLFAVLTLYATEACLVNFFTADHVKALHFAIPVSYTHLTLPTNREV